MPKILSTILFLLFTGIVSGQGLGLVVGNVMDEKKKALEGASVQLSPLVDSLPSRTVLSAADGSFTLENIPFGYYRLRVSFVGFQALTLDSIHFRAERYDFNLNDIVLKS